MRAIEAGHSALGYKECDFSSQRIDFEIFSFEHNFLLEHWKNIQARPGPNQSGHDMVEDPTEAAQLDKTRMNRALVRSFVETELIN
jgi:hypothetical protein